jgi:hypothetical protein
MPILSTATAPPAERFAVWREIITQHFIPLRPECSGEAPFNGEIHAEAVGGVSLSLVRSGGQRVHRGRREIAGGTASILFVNVQLAGRSSYVQGGEEVSVAPGDIFLIDPNRSFQLGCEAPFAQLSVKFPLDELRPWRRRLDSAAGMKLPRALIRIQRYCAPMRARRSMKRLGSIELRSSWRRSM